MRKRLVLSIIGAAFLGLVFFKLGTSSGSALNCPVVEGPYERIEIIGEISNKGVFDPTVEYDSSGEVGYLVYSGLEAPKEDLHSPHVKYIHTHLAKTTDHGRTWKFVKRISESRADSISSPFFAKLYKLESERIEGTWQHEVPTLVYDPDDPHGKKWKLFWHMYFSADREAGQERPRIFSHSWIMFKEASSPEGLDKAEAVKLFGTDTACIAAKYSFQDFTGGKASVSTYTEPGALYWEGKIYLALSYFYHAPGRKIPHKLILVSSSDHGQTWRYIGVLLDERDAFGDFFNFWGASLAEDGGRLFLLVSPIHKRFGYQGTFVLEFADIEKGLLKRDAQGKLVVRKYLKRGLPGNLNSGQSDYHKYNTYGGIIFPQVDLSTFPKIAQIFNTGERLSDLEPPNLADGQIHQKEKE